MTYRVDSEVGRLKQVIVHRPDVELQRLTPSNMHEFLFDDVLWVRKARQEHDAFVDALREHDIAVYLFHELLGETLAIPEARKYVLDRVFDERVYGPLAIDALRNSLDVMDPEALAQLLIGGVTKREILDRIDEPRSVVFRTLGLDAFVLAPLPNHLFTRDASAWIHDGVAINSMRKKARMRETVHYEAIYGWHPMFADAGFNVWSSGSSNAVATTEGGDLHVVGNGTVLVGMSERTRPAGIERLAAELFAKDVVQRIVALAMPESRAFMHLDTVMSMVDERSFTVYAGMGTLPSYTIEPGDTEKELKVTGHPPEDMYGTIADAIGVDDLRILTP